MHRTSAHQVCINTVHGTAVVIFAMTLSLVGCSAETQTGETSSSAPANPASATKVGNHREVVNEKLQKLAKAMLAHEKAWKSFPAAGIDYPRVDERGKPKFFLSWRVRLLPFLGEQELYDKFKLDESWDSPHNQALIPEMPDIYRLPNQAGDDHKTVFVGAVYPEDMPNNGFYQRPDKPQELQPYLSGTVFDLLPSRGGSQTISWGGIGDRHEIVLKMQESRLSDIRDGFINTAMILEVAPKDAVVWTQPADWVFDVEHPRRGLPPDSFQAAFVDESVHFIPLDKVDDEFLRRMFCLGDGNRLELPK